MKVLFISLLEINSISEHGLYSDLLREFARNGHFITVLSPVEKRTGRKGKVISEENVKIIKVKIGNIQKTNYVEKGISTLRLGGQLIRAIKQNCPDLSFDLILYATPPVTIVNLVKKVKKLTKATTFLMLKDIWPQEMVDLGIIPNKGLLYNYFVGLEKRLYKASDYIGYTSEANKRYLVDHNVSEEKLVAVNNSVDPYYCQKSEIPNRYTPEQYGIKKDQTVFFYGGNLGKPQDIDFLIECLDTQVSKQNRFILICGQGTEYHKLETYFEKNKPQNMKLFPFLPKDEYDQLIMMSDVGLIFLNHRFTVPNCPSRFYTYMEYSKPIFACTDKATDIQEDICRGNFGWWCESTNAEVFSRMMDGICDEGNIALSEKGKRARLYLEEHFTVDKDYKRIIDRVIDRER